jgi:hypothetical protein
VAGPQTLIKQPSESRLFSMDFSALLAPSETVTGVTSVTALPAGLTLSGSAVASGATANQRILGGAGGVMYKVTFVVTTSLGNTLEGEGLLKVEDL